MKVFVISVYPFAYRVDICSSSYSDERRALDLARELVALTHSVDLLASVPAYTKLEPEIGMVPWNDAWNTLEYDAVVILGGVLGPARDRPTEFVRLNDHPNVIYWADFSDVEVIERVRVLLATSTVVREALTNRLAPGRSGILPWFAQDIPELPSPWQTDTHRVVYCGSTQRRHVSIFNWIADAGFEVWIGGGGWPAAERDRVFTSNVHFMTDICAPSDRADANVHGPIRYGAQFPFYQHATAGIAFGAGGRGSTSSSKVFDYASCGLPTISEAGVGSNGFLDIIGGGEVVAYNDPEAIVRALRTLIACPPDRQRIRREALAFGTMRDRAFVLDAYMRSM